MVKKVGDTWKAYKDIDKTILKIIENNDLMTTGSIKEELEKQGIVITWVTTKNYLTRMHVDKQIQRIDIGERFFWKLPKSL